MNWSNTAPSRKAAGGHVRIQSTRERKRGRFAIPRTAGRAHQRAGATSVTNQPRSAARPQSSVRMVTTALNIPSIITADLHLLMGISRPTVRYFTVAANAAPAILHRPSRPSLTPRRAPPVGLERESTCPIASPAGTRVARAPPVRSDHPEHGACSLIRSSGRWQPSSWPSPEFSPSSPFQAVIAIARPNRLPSWTKPPRTFPSTSSMAPGSAPMKHP